MLRPFARSLSPNFTLKFEARSYFFFKSEVRKILYAWANTISWL